MNTVLTDMSGAYIEHSTVITAFTAMVYSQIKSSTCKVYPDNVQYKWIVDWEKRQVEIYNLDYDENEEPQYYLFKIITGKK